MLPHSLVAAGLEANQVHEAEPKQKYHLHQMLKKGIVS